MKVTVVSGGFDPIHSGHIAYFDAAKSLGDKLVVALNSDDWLIKKKGKYFMTFDERKSIIERLDMVDELIDFQDDDLGSCCDGLEKVKLMYPQESIIFCNGGDRNRENIPEMSVEGIDFSFGVGEANKKNSSSLILKDFQFDSEERVWGKFFNLYTSSGLKLKELIVNPQSGMSFQRHFFRNEIWFISQGSCKVNYSIQDPDSYKEIHLKTEEVFHVPKESWHQIFNPFEEPCYIIEIQFGEKTSEDDIERLRYYDKN